MRDLFQKFSNMEAKLSEHFKREVVVGISAAKTNKRMIHNFSRFCQYQYYAHAAAILNCSCCVAWPGRSIMRFTMKLAMGSEKCQKGAVRTASQYGPCGQDPIHRAEEPDCT